MKQKMINKGSIYIAGCCLLIAAAVIGFAGRQQKEPESADKIAETLPEQIPVTETEAPKAAAVEETREESRTENPQTSEKAPVDSVEVSKNTKIEEKIHFSRPVPGKIIEEYSDGELIYNEALRDWRTHNGVDIEAAAGEQVFAPANGTVSNVYDSNLGHCLEIDHQNGYMTVFANLEESTLVKPGDEVSEGNVIGTVGNTALGDATELPHLHFEIIKDGINVDPIDFLE